MPRVKIRIKRAPEWVRLGAAPRQAPACQLSGGQQQRLAQAPSHMTNGRISVRRARTAPGRYRELTHQGTEDRVPAFAANRGDIET